MSRVKTSTVSLRTSEEIKDLLRQASEREHRSVVSMVEVLVMEYARQHGIKAKPAARRKSGNA